jgi:hypothetical protein
MVNVAALNSLGLKAMIICIFFYLMKVLSMQETSGCTDDDDDDDDQPATKQKSVGQTSERCACPVYDAWNKHPARN